MTVPLTGLGTRSPIPDLPLCACGCRRAASRGFPGDVHYAFTCVPPALRFPWEPGCVAQAAVPELPAIAAAAPAVAPSDLFSGFAPA